MLPPRSPASAFNACRSLKSRVAITDRVVPTPEWAGGTARAKVFHLCGGWWDAKIPESVSVVRGRGGRSAGMRINAWSESRFAIAASLSSPQPVISVGPKSSPSNGSMPAMATFRASIGGAPHKNAGMFEACRDRKVGEHHRAHRTSGPVATRLAAGQGAARKCHRHSSAVNHAGLMPAGNRAELTQGVDPLVGLRAARLTGRVYPACAPGVATSPVARE
jgi:hypothetical protein